MYQLLVDSPKSCSQGELPYPDPMLQGNLALGRALADGGVEHFVTLSGTFGCTVKSQGCQTLITCDRNGATDAYTLTTQADGSLKGTLEGRCACTTRKVSCSVTAKR